MKEIIYLYINKITIYLPKCCNITLSSLVGEKSWTFGVPVPAWEPSIVKLTSSPHFADVNPLPLNKTRLVSCIGV